MVKKQENGCICEGNWRLIVAETETLLDKLFVDDKGVVYVFFGIVHGSDDYYYGMCTTPGGVVTLLSCVGSIEGHGFTLLPEDEQS